MIVFQVLKVGPRPNGRIFLKEFHQSKNQEQKKKLSRSASEAILVRNARSMSSSHSKSKPSSPEQYGNHWKEGGGSHSPPLI
jgi:hypothetical protein